MRAFAVRDRYRIGNAVEEIFWMFYKGNQGV